MRKAFTLVELLVVLSIMAISVLTFYLLKNGLTLAPRDSGRNVMSTAAQAARVTATREINFLADLGGGHGHYSGTAILVTPTEIRLVENYQHAKDGTDPLELMTPELNGYRDVLNREYISVPRNVGLAGMSRDLVSGRLLLFMPPFAVRFDESGHLSIGQIPSDHFQVVSTDPPESIYIGDGNEPTTRIYYDGNYDDDFDTTQTRPAGYSPVLYDPDLTGYDKTATFDNTKNAHRVPFEAIETVIAVVAFDKTEFFDAMGGAIGAEADGGVSDAARVWILANSTTVNFNRYTGTVIRDD